jgi:hypothetical protein
MAFSFFRLSNIVLSSHKELPKLSKPLWSYALSNIITERYGPIPFDQIPNLLLQTDPVLPPVDPDQMIKAVKLIVGTIAINIKKFYCEGDDRLGFDNDLLISIEVFATALHTLPVSSEEEELLRGKFKWNTILCDVLGIEFENDIQCKQFKKLAVELGLEATNDLLKIDELNPGFYRDANRVLLKLPLNPYLFQAGVIYSTAFSAHDIFNCYGGLLFLLAFSLSRVTNFSSPGWVRRSGEIQRQLLQGNGLLSSLSESSARELSSLIDAKIKDGCDPAILCQEISDAVNRTYTHVPQLIAVSGHFKCKGLASIQIIARAIGKRTDVPWINIFDRFPTLSAELLTVDLFVKKIEGDAFAGIKYGGISKQIKNLLYLSVRALIVLGGEKSLRAYGGIGGDSSQQTVPMKITIDAIIDELKERQVKLASGVQVDTVDAPLADTYRSTFERLSKFLKFCGTRGGGDDDDQPPSGPAVHSIAGPSTTIGEDVPDAAPSEPDSDDKMETTSSRSGSKRTAPTVSDSRPDKERRITRS